jgi:hypothetical protein
MPGGFKFVGTELSDPTGRARSFDVPASHATRLAKGDVVRLNGTSDATTGNPQIDTAAAAQSITGVIVGITPQYSTEAFTDTGLAASVAGSVTVCTDPMAIYEVDVVNGPLVVADAGLNADLVATAATVSGGMTISNMTLNATGKATTSTLQFRIIKLLTDVNGVLGNRALVRVNNSTTIAGAAGV